MKEARKGEKMYFLLLNDLLAQWGGYGRGGYGGYGPGMMGWGYGGWFSSIIGIIFLIAVVAGVFFLIRWIISASTKQGSHESGAGDSALEILRKRYARGEINKEEFEEKKKDLEKQ
jgi:putative membrane protein